VTRLTSLSRSVAGKRVIVTGAASGMGRATAHLFADEGAQVAVVDIGGEGVTAVVDEIRTVHGEHAAVGFVCDVADHDALKWMVAGVAETLGGIDVLVNNAGVYHAARLVDIEPEDFDRVMRVNVHGAFHVLQFVLRHLQARRAGKVVNIASTAGKWGSMNQSAYNASKHALVGLTRCAAVELGPLGICINAICPGFVETDMLQNFSAHSAITGLSFEQILANGKARVPLRRFLQPQEIAHLAVYLGSAESDGMTGQSILLDGGMLMV
jgi:NAD(P)-dependent dehydrogenase (short-subunit alcohol dehydrogenase family)